MITAPVPDLERSVTLPFVLLLVKVTVESFGNGAFKLGPLNTVISDVELVFALI